MKVKNIKSDTHTLRSFKIAKLTSLIPKLSTFFKIFAYLVKYFIKRFTKYRAYAKINWAGINSYYCIKFDSDISTQKKA